MSTNRILLVDDNDGQRITLGSILKRAGFDVTSANCGQAAITAADHEKFAGVLLDIKMPDMTGIEVLKIIKEKQPETMVIMMTGFSETDFAIDALNNGATAFLLKPANIEQVKMLVNQAIERQRLIEENQDMSVALQEWAQELEKKVEERTAMLREANRTTLDLYEDLKKNFDSSLEILSIAIDQRDKLTASHSFRVTEYSLEIAKQLNMEPNDLEKLRYAGLLHDLGKVEVDKKILCKDGSLSKEEYNDIQQHALGTGELLSKFKFKHELNDVPLIASSHHERFDGMGYPKKLKGNEIPFLSRILSVADVLDAITSTRHYRTAMVVTEALSAIKREAGGHFDPKCVDALFQIKTSEFVKIHMADNIHQINSDDLVVLMSYTLQQFYELLRQDDYSREELDVIRRFHLYYQGVLPPKFEGKIKGPPQIDAEAA
ncbi:hypothetical protein BVX98_07970 [bacterium F11]|nr:hypothetical protein BVX98_07970 [bacterium F11]